MVPPLFFHESGNLQSLLSCDFDCLVWWLVGGGRGLYSVAGIHLSKILIRLFMGNSPSQMRAVSSSFMNRIPIQETRPIE